MIIKCDGCGNDYKCSTKKYNENNKLGLRIFCSSKCFYNAKSNEKRVFVDCAFCGKELFRLKSDIEKSKTGNVYCNSSCSSSKNNSLFRTWEDNPNFKHGLNKYRRQKLKVSENKCEDCGIDDLDVLEIHHLDGNRKNNKMENLAILCANCHKKRHKSKLI